MDTDDFPMRFSEALVTEIKAEMGRQSLSSRALGRLIDKTSAYMSDRLDGGSVKTGKRVQLTARDLSAIARALGLTEVELVTRARDYALRGLAPVTDLSSRRVAGGSETLEDQHLDEAVAKKDAIDPYETEDDV